MIEFSLYTVFLLIFIGCSSGLLAGLLGVGGGIIYGPVILFMLKGWNISENIIFPIAFGTSLFIIIFTSLSAVIKYLSLKSIMWRAVLIMSIFSIVGAGLGAYVSVNSPGWILQRLYGLLLLIVSWRITKEYKTDETIDELFKLSYLSISGFVIGFISSMFGIGGGVVGVPIMIIILRFPIKKVAATSLCIILFTSIAGVLGYILSGLKNINLPNGSFGYVNIKIAAPFIFGAVTCAPIGAYINNKVKTATLKRVFALFLAVVSIKFLFF